jgi:hypothetical protein
MAEKRDPAECEEDRVVAPGGPRSPGTLEHVEPGEAVRRNPDGTYTVIPAEEPDDV